ncbi:MAG: MFS transporter [Chloroflexota bacterium]
MGCHRGTGGSTAVAATIVGSFLVRLGGAATGVMLGLLLSSMHRRGMADSSAMVVGLLMASFYLSELLGAPVAGLLIDRRGLRPLLFAGPFFGVIATALIAIPSHVGLLAAARLLQGLTTACTVPAALAFLSDARRVGGSERGRIMGFFEAGSIGGLAIGYTLGGLLWDGLHRAGFWDVILVYGIAAGLFVFVKIEHSSKVKRPPSATWQALRQTWDLVPAWLALSAAAGLWFGQAAYQLSGAHPRTHQLLTHGLTGSTIGIIFGVYTLLFATGTIGWGFFIGRLSTVTAMRIGSVGVIAAAAALLGLNHARDLGGFWFGLMLVLSICSLAGETAFTPAALTLLAARSDGVPEGRGAVMGVYSMLLGAGQLIGATLGGLFAMSWGVDGLIVATAILGCLGLLTVPQGGGLTILFGRTPPWQAQEGS